MTTRREDRDRRSGGYGALRIPRAAGNRAGAESKGRQSKPLSCRFFISGKTRTCRGHRSATTLRRPASRTSPGSAATHGRQEIEWCSGGVHALARHRQRRGIADAARGRDEPFLCATAPASRRSAARVCVTSVKPRIREGPGRGWLRQPRSCVAAGSSRSPIGFAKRYPCASDAPISRTCCSIASVSTPSMMTAPEVLRDPEGRLDNAPSAAREIL